MRLSVLLEVEEGLTWPQLRRVAAAVERLGFEGLWLSDHLDSLHQPGVGGLETWTALGVVAAETERIRLGPLVTPVTFRHPALVARMVAGLDVLSGGRMVLGLGAGWNDAEHRAYGVDFPPAAERTARLEEVIQVIDRLQGDAPASFEGRYYRVEAVDARPKPVQRPRVPLLIGGGGERRTLPLAARYADEWNLTTADPALFRAKSARLDEACRAVGRDPRAIRRSVAVGFLIGADRRDLDERAGMFRTLVPRLAGVPPAAVPAAARELGWVVGTVDEVIEQLRRLAAAGVEEVVLNQYAFDDDAALALIAGLGSRV